MIVLYSSPGCASCRKVRQWLKDRNLKFVEKNIFTSELSDKEIKHLLMRSENGTDDIISKRSKVMKESMLDLEELSMSELITFIQRHPSVLKRPIVMNDKSFLVGYDDEEIDAFLPSELRHSSLVTDEMSEEIHIINDEVKDEEV
ncbi:transcriptional regulator Spx [Erysipelothrix urinaevulpis]|uniref:transcriptional regulator Spx n=1 Tax=Erysipelothrix urinaevulpis TaxID=2683717 RepID=UPI00135991E7|nr:transcriptional regulator Spx [Erysipelothrix urinaevulpis]